MQINLLNVVVLLQINLLLKTKLHKISNQLKNFNKPVIGKFEKKTVYSTFKENILVLADI